MTNDKPKLPPLPEMPKWVVIEEGTFFNKETAYHFYLSMEQWFTALERWKADIEASMVRYYCKVDLGPEVGRLNREDFHTHYIDAFRPPQPIEEPKVDRRVPVKDVVFALRCLNERAQEDLAARIERDGIKTDGDAGRKG